MRYAMLLKPHPNARYRQSVSQLAKIELQTILRAWSIQAEPSLEMLGSEPFLFFDAPQMPDGLWQALSRHSACCLLCEATENGFLKPLEKKPSFFMPEELPQVLKYKGKTISDVLDMTVEEALKFFENIPRIKSKLQTLYDVGLSYVKLGQPSTTLSGGEAQRIKLATELSKRSTGHTIYILDEPTTGLHFADVHKLIDILHRLTEGGNTVVVIEHNLDVIKTADYIIDMGPEGGDRGGTVIACGTPEEVAKNELSYTGQYIKRML